MYWLFSLNNSFLWQFEHDLEVHCSGGGPGAVILPMLKLQGAPHKFCSVFLSALPCLAALSFSCCRPAYCFCLWKREMEWKHGVVVVSTVWELLVQGRWYIKKTWPWCLANERLVEGVEGPVRLLCCTCSLSWMDGKLCSGISEDFGVVIVALS